MPELTELSRVNLQRGRCWCGWDTVCRAAVVLLLGGVTCSVGADACVHACRYKVLAQQTKEDARCAFMRILRTLPYGNATFFAVRRIGELQLWLMYFVDSGLVNTAAMAQLVCGTRPLGGSVANRV